VAFKKKLLTGQGFPHTNKKKAKLFHPQETMATKAEKQKTHLGKGKGRKYQIPVIKWQVALVLVIFIFLTAVWMIASSGVVLTDTSSDSTPYKFSIFTIIWGVILFIIGAVGAGYIATDVYQVPVREHLRKLMFGNVAISQSDAEPEVGSKSEDDE
jgi:hypothetical protein